MDIISSILRSDDCNCELLIPYMEFLTELVKTNPNDVNASKEHIMRDIAELKKIPYKGADTVALFKLISNFVLEYMKRKPEPKLTPIQDFKPLETYNLNHVIPKQVNDEWFDTIAPKFDLPPIQVKGDWFVSNVQPETNGVKIKTPQLENNVQHPELKSVISSTFDPYFDPASESKSSPVKNKPIMWEQQSESSGYQLTFVLDDTVCVHPASLFTQSNLIQGKTKSFIDLIEVNATSETFNLLVKFLKAKTDELRIAAFLDIEEKNKLANVINLAKELSLDQVVGFLQQFVIN